MGIKCFVAVAGPRGEAGPAPGGVEAGHVYVSVQIFVPTAETRAWAPSLLAGAGDETGRRAGETRCWQA